MALNANNVHLGPSRIWFGVTAPATGNPPTFVPHTAGIPSTGTEIGFTTGDTVFSKGVGTVDIGAEQTNAPIISFINEESCEVRFEAMERTFKLLQALFHNNGSVQDSDGMRFWGGGGANSLRTQTVFFSSLRPSASGKYEFAMVYKAYSVNAFETAYRKANTSNVSVVMRGQLDTSRDEGDQLYQYDIEA